MPTKTPTLMLPILWAAGFFVPFSFSQEKPAEVHPAAAHDALTQHLLDWPVLGTAFHQMLLRHWDEGDWRQLDQKWQAAQATQPRFLLLRGLLAERQGNLKQAAARYAGAGGTDEWARYHRGRLMALVGDIPNAKAELMAVATRTTRLWLFKQSTLALGEITLLQDGADVAENLYLDLWDKQTDFAMRVAILEPLLSHSARRGQGWAFADGIKPAGDAEPGKRRSGASAEAEAEGLKKMARAFLNPSVGPNGPPLDRLLIPAMFLSPGVRDLPARTAAAVSHATESPPDDVNLGMVLRSTLQVHGVEGFSTVARAVKARLRANPATLATLFSQDAGTEAAVLRFLDTEIFEGSEDSRWLALSLWIRFKAGADPQSLKADAEKLSRAVVLESWVSRVGNEPEGMSGSVRTPLTFRLPTSPGSPPMLQVPSPSVIWNLRGGAFVEAAAARMRQGLHGALQKESAAAMGYMFQLQGTRRMKGAQEFLTGGGPNFPTGEELRAWLWDSRRMLGLTDTFLKDTAATPADKALDVLLRGDPTELVRFVEDDAVMAKLHSRWLCLFLFALGRVNQESYPSAAGGPDAATRIVKRLLERHPDWIVLALQYGVPLPKIPAIDAAAKTELVATQGASMNMRPSGGDLSAFWRSLDPAWGDAEAQALASLQARQQLAITLLPHPLWDLEWQPSIMRDARIIPDRFRMFTSGMGSSGSGDPSQGGKFDKFNGPLSSTLVEAFNTAIFLPQPARQEELRSLVARHPIVSDYLAAWEAVTKVEGAATSAAGMRRPGTVPAPMLEAVYVALGQSATPTARFLVALMHDITGDKAQAREVAAPLKDTQSAIGQWAANLESGATGDPLAGAARGRPGSAPGAPPGVPVVPSTRPTLGPSTPGASRIPPDPAGAVQAIFADRAIVAEFKQGNWGNIGMIMSRHGVREPEIYEYLRKEAKPAPEFALKARIMAVLARYLKRPDDEINAAELLDLRLNPDDLAAILPRAVRYANAGNDLAAIDAFLEALRRFDFESPPDLSRLYWLAKEQWLERLRRSGRIDEVVAALGEALERTKPNTAHPETVDYALLAFQVRMPATPDASAGKSSRLGTTNFARSQAADSGAKPAPTSVAGSSTAVMERVLNLIQQRQQHLFAMRFDQWMETAVNLDKAGEAGVATKLSRAVLLSWWPKELAHIKGTSSSYVYVSTAQRLMSWGYAMNRIGPGAKIPSLFTLALRGEDGAAFPKQSEQAAMEHPEDEQLVSVALMAAALRGPLPEKQLELARKLHPVEAMRVAWRLCELAPPKNVPLKALAPMLCEGIKLHAAARISAYDSNHYAELLNLLPWLGKLATQAQIVDVMPSLALGLATVEMSTWPEMWHPLVALARGCEDPAAFNVVCDALVKRYTSIPEPPKFDHEWRQHIIHGLSTVVKETEERDTAPLATLAFDLWMESWKRFHALTSISAATTTALAEALLISGSDNQLEAFTATLDQMAALTGDPNLSSLQERIKDVRALLRDEGGPMPVVQAWADPPAVTGAAPQVQWRMIFPQLTKDPATGMELPDKADSGLIHIAFGDSDALMNKLSGRYELEFVAGDDPDVFRTVAKVASAPHKGQADAPQLPASGYLRATLRHPRTGTTTLSLAALYSVKENVLDSAQPGDAPTWTEELASEYGKPITPLVEIAKYTDYLVTVTGQYHLDEDQLGQVRLVNLNAEMKPVRAFDLPDVKGRHTRLFRPSEGLFLEPRDFTRYADPDESGSMPRYFVLTSAMGRSLYLPGVQVRPFSKRSAAQTADAAPLLKTDLLAPLGFYASSWYICETMPRATFTGAGHLVAYDTSQVPWKEMLRLESAELTGTEWPMLFKPGEICLYQPKAEEKLRPGLRIIKLEPGTTLEASPRTALPFVPAISDLSPTEHGLIFATSGITGSVTKTWAAWLDAGAEIQTTTFERPLLPGGSYVLAPPSIAWWDNDGGVTLAEGGFLFHLRHDKEGLHHLKTETGVASLETVPEGKIPARSLLQPRWVFRGQDILLRRDPRSGAVLATYRLPVKCTFSPLWYDDESRGVCLLTTENKLVRVIPPKREEPKDTK